VDFNVPLTVALNDLADLKTNAHLLQYDSSYGPFTGLFPMAIF
jgi:glyceraldehyde-3-phosphate dehydrogenase/erythrose-4-phosphate dehydrogenase